MKFRVALAVLLIVATWAPIANSVGLSSDQQARLDRGEVVVLDVLPPGGDAAGSQGGTAMVIIHASPEAVWNVLVDYPRHTGLYPRVVNAEVLSTRAEHTLVRYVVGVGPFSFGFHVDNYADPTSHRLVWQLAQNMHNDLFRSSWGYWKVDSHNGGAVLTYAMGARTVLPSFLTRGAERDGLVETVKAVRERAERGA